MGAYLYDGSGNITAIGSDTFLYDAEGRLIGRQSESVWAESFFGFHAFSVDFYVRGFKPAKLRLYPKRR